MKLKLDYETAMGDLLEIASADPERVYESGRLGGCRYFENDGAPSCIIGHVFAKHGVTKDDLTGMNTRGISYLRTAGDLDADAKTMMLLRDVQGMQDAGKPWFFAVNEAVHLVNSIDWEGKLRRDAEQRG